MRRAITWKAKLIRLLIYLALILLAVTYLYPVFFMFVNSIKNQVEYMVDPFLVDLANGHYENYTLIFSNFQIQRYLANTLLTAVLKLVYSMPLAICASYALAKLNFKGKEKVNLGVMTAMFIPFQVIMIPVYVMLAKVKLINTFFGLVLVTGTLSIPGNILLLTSNFRSIPGEMLDAASIDGCGYFRTITNIIVPMGKAAISICVIMSFIGSWNDLLAPMVIMKGVDKQLVMPALNNLVSLYSKDIPFQLTGMLIASVPAILIYIALQKQIIMGVSAGSIK